MRHDVERYRLILKTETNPRARKVLLAMIEELKSRIPAESTVVTATVAAATAKPKPRTYFPV